MGIRARGGRCGRFVTVLVVALAVTPIWILALPGAGAAQLGKVTIGYSKSPGWLPLAVAQQQGIFKKDGLDVKLKYFTDYVSSLDAMSAGKLDANAQTLNDTMAAAAGGSQQTIVVVNDDSAGNDAIVCDESIASVADMKGKLVVAEKGLADHFLLLQGLAKAGLTQDDIDFRGVLTADAAASFADGQFDCVAAPAPFTQEALKRPGSHVLFNSRDFPGAVPEEIVVSRAMVTKEPTVVQKLVNAWYDTLAYVQAHRDKAEKIMADAAKTSRKHYKDLALGTRILSLDDGLQALEPGDTSASVQYTAGLVNSFMVSSGVAKTKAPIGQLFAPQFAQAYATAHLAGAKASAPAA